MHEQWLETFWRWFFEAIDREDWEQALILGHTIEAHQRRQHCQFILTNVTGAKLQQKKGYHLMIYQISYHVKNAKDWLLGKLSIFQM